MHVLLTDSSIIFYTPQHPIIWKSVPTWGSIDTLVEGNVTQKYNKGGMHLVALGRPLLL